MCFKTGRRVILTSHGSGKSLRIVDKQVNGLGGKGKKGESLFYMCLLSWLKYIFHWYICSIVLCPCEKK